MRQHTHNAAVVYAVTRMSRVLVVLKGYATLENQLDTFEYTITFGSRTSHGRVTQARQDIKVMARVPA